MHQHGLYWRRLTVHRRGWGSEEASTGGSGVLSHTGEVARRNQLLSFHSSQGPKAWSVQLASLGHYQPGWVAGHVALGEVSGEMGDLFPEGERHRGGRATTDAQCGDP